jgi:hypothetical protein
MRQSPTAADRLVGEQVKTEAAIELKPPLVDQQACGDADTGGDAVSEKSLVGVGGTSANGPWKSGPSAAFCSKERPRR